MFDPIKAPPHEYLGPAVGHGTEFGDSWHTAVGKINAGFAKIVEAIKGGVEHTVAAVDPEARKAFSLMNEAHRDAVARVNELEHRLANMEQKLIAMTMPADPNIYPDGSVSVAEGQPATADPEASLDAVAKALTQG